MIAIIAVRPVSRRTAKGLESTGRGLAEDTGGVELDEGVELDDTIGETGRPLPASEMGDVAPPFSVRGDRVVLVKLLGRKRGEPKPLQSVKQGIVQKLKPGKFAQAREDYIEKVVAYSQIDINQKSWDKLIADQKK